MLLRPQVEPLCGSLALNQNHSFSASLVFESAAFREIWKCPPASSVLFPSNAIGKNVASLRVERNLRQEKLAEKVGMRARLHSMRRGWGILPSLPTLVRLHAVIGKTFSSVATRCDRDSRVGLGERRSGAEGAVEPQGSSAGHRQRGNAVELMWKLTCDSWQTPPEDPDQKTRLHRENHFATLPSASSGGSVARRNPRSQWTSTHSWSRRLRSMWGLILCSSVSE